MAYVPNLTWTVADADRVMWFAARGYSASGIARAMGRAEAEVRTFCTDNRISLRGSSMVRQ